MSQQSITKQRQLIRRSVYGLLAIVITIFALILFLLQLQDSETDHRAEIANEYHLTIIEKTLELQSTITEIRLWFRDHHITKQSSTIKKKSSLSPILIELSKLDQISAFKHEIDRCIGEIITIQALYADPEFKAISSVLEQTHIKVQTDLDELQSASSHSLQKIDAIVAPLSPVIHQLQRLHQYAYQEIQLSKENYDREKGIELISLIFILTIVGVFGAIWMLRQVGYTLKSLTKVQSKLQESEQNFSSVTENMHDGVFVNFKGKHVFVNESMARMLGYEKAEDLIGTTIEDVVHPDELEKVLTRFRSRTQGNEEETQYETTFITKTGEPLPVELNAAITLWKGKTAGLVTVRNITERKQSEQELQSERDFATSLVNTAPVIVLLLDPRGYIQYANPYFEKLSGYRLEEIKDKEWFSTFLPARDQDRIRELFQNATNEIPVRGNINPIIIRDGELCEIEWYGQTMRDAKGAITGVLSIGQDITERKQAEQVLRSQAIIIDQIHDSVISTDLEGLITSWNCGSDKLFGYNSEEVLGKHVAILYPEEQHAFLQNELIPTLVANGAHEVETRLRHKSGKEFFAHVSLSMLYDEHGNATGMIGYSLDITARKESIAALEQSEERYRVLARVSPVGIFRTDAHGNCVYANESWCELAGMSKEEALGEGWGQALHPEDRDRVFAEWYQAAADKIPFQTECRFQRPDGKITWLLSLAEAEFDAGGQMVGYVGTITDISERKQIEVALQESEKLLAKAQTLANIGHWKLTPATGEITGSDELFRIFDLSREQATLESFVEVVHPDDREMNVAAIQRGAEHGESWDIEHRVVSRDGKDKWVHAIGEAITDKTGNVIELMGTVQDITRLKQAGIALLESELWMRSIFNSLDEAVLVVNPDRKVVNVNAAALRIFGYSTEEILNSSTELFHVDHEHFEEFGEYIYQAFSKDQTANFEFVAKRKNGEVFSTEHTVSLLKSQDGKLKGIVSVIRDISMRKQAENELAKHREHLEELVEERTQELRNTQDKLIRKERLATLGQLTATVSHELRNPLGAMRPSLFVIEKRSDKKDERVQQAIERVDRSIDRCDHIIDELLDFTRITKLNRHTTRIDDWLEALIDEQDIPKGIRVKKDLRLKDVELIIDADRLRRAVINIVENACHTMLDGKQQTKTSKSSCLGIKTRSSKKRIEISITDTGAGIPENIMNKIFEPLFSTKGFGVGLGMPTVKQIMEQHGGGIKVDTKENKGTTVTLWLPSYVAGEGAVT